MGNGIAKSLALSPKRPLDPVAVYVAGLRSLHSRRAVLSRLRAAAKVITQDEAADVGSVSWVELRYEHLAALQAELVRCGFAGATINVTTTAIRGVLRTAWRIGQVDYETYARAVAAIKQEPRPEQVAGRMVSPDEVRALFRVAALHPDRRQAARDVAILAVGLGAGLRRDEIVSLDLGDIDADTGALHVRCGKGRRSRRIFLPPSALPAIRRWLDVRGPAPGAFFCRIHWARRPELQETIPPISGQMVAWLLDRLCAAGDIDHVSPHDLRRTHASMALDLGVDLVTVQKQLGHTKIDTTARYDRRGEIALQRMADQIELPIDARRAGR